MKPLERWYAHAALNEKLKSQSLVNGTILAAPVIVVGNLTVGGTGKSPVVAALVKTFSEAGFRPGILSRGYGAKGVKQPLVVLPDMDVSIAGDEPLMLAQSTGAAVVVDTNRLRGARYLIESCLVDLVICDDGLQHYRLPRDIEILLIDSRRGLGNGRLLPVGPLREPADRIRRVNYVLSNGITTDLDAALARKVDAEVHVQPSGWMNLHTGEVLPLHPAPVKGDVLAVSGIGNPARFYRTLTLLGLSVTQREFADHHSFSPADLQSKRGLSLVMTAKDAVKCRHFYLQDPSLPPAWALLVKAELPQVFTDTLIHQVRALVTKSGRSGVISQKPFAAELPVAAVAAENES